MSGEGGTSASFPGDNTKYSKHSAEGLMEVLKRQDSPVGRGCRAEPGAPDPIPLPPLPAK